MNHEARQQAISEMLAEIELGSLSGSQQDSQHVDQ